MCTNVYVHVFIIVIKIFLPKYEHFSKKYL